jgi:hypothetical protein
VGRTRVRYQNDNAPARAVERTSSPDRTERGEASGLVIKGRAAGVEIEVPRNHSRKEGRVLGPETDVDPRMQSLCSNAIHEISVRNVDEVPRSKRGLPVTLPSDDLVVGRVAMRPTEGRPRTRPD